MHKFSKFPFFCPILGFDEHNMILILRYYPLGSLDRLIKNEKSEIRWTGKLIHQWASDIAHGLEILHSHDVVHADLKSANVLIQKIDCADHRVVLTDFGIGKILSKEPAVKDLKVIHVMGATIPYASPEVLRELRRGIKPISSLSEAQLAKSADMYAFSCVLNELLCRALVWRKASDTVDGGSNSNQISDFVPSVTLIND